MAENFANEYQTTLNGAIDASQTSVVVTSATGAPAANFRIRVDDEYMLVTAVAGTTFTVTRGVEGSTAASHLDAATVTHILTAGGLVQAIGDGATGAWTSYTPTVTATTTNPTIVLRGGRYRKLDEKTYAIEITINFATGDSAGNGSWSISLPPGLTCARASALAGWMLDSGSRWYVCSAYTTIGLTVIERVLHTETGNAGQVSHTAPFTWANGDALGLSGVIEVQ